MALLLHGNLDKNGDVFEYGEDHLSENIIESEQNIINHNDKFYAQKELDKLIDRMKSCLSGSKYLNSVIKIIEDVKSTIWELPSLDEFNEKTKRELFNSIYEVYCKYFIEYSVETYNFIFRVNDYSSLTREIIINFVSDLIIKDDLNENRLSISIENMSAVFGLNNNNFYYSDLKLSDI